MELKLRDEIEREASEWQTTEYRLSEARNRAEGSKRLEALQKDVDAAIAARRGPRLEAAKKLIENPAFARLLGSKERAYLNVCQANETEQIDKQRRIIGRAFMRPAQQTLEDGHIEHALRLAAGGALLANDLDLKLIPELWRLAARAILQSRTSAVLKGHEHAVLSAAFSPDGTRVVTASSDNTARLWDAATGTEIAVLRGRGHEHAVLSAAFSPDGTRVVTASDDNTARLWDISHSGVVCRGQALALTAALARGIGSRTATERLDFLMQDAPDDMFSAALAMLGDRAGALAETVAALHTPLNPNCYLSPTEFAAKFGLRLPKAE
jgi:hypothetical protein